MSKLSKDEILKDAMDLVRNLLNKNGYDGDHYMIKIIIADVKNKKVKTSFYFDNRIGNYSLLECANAEANMVQKTVQDYNDYWGSTSKENNTN